MSANAFDILKKDASGEPVWVEAVADFNTAQIRVKALAACFPGEYMIFSQAERRIVETYRTNGVRLSET